MADKIALVDFCETIADFQTFDPYLLFVITREHPCCGKIMTSAVIEKSCELLTHAMRMLGWKHYLYKLLLVRQLKGLQRERLMEYGKQYYAACVKSHLIAPTIELISKLKEQGCRLMIVSGGSDLYIHCFAEEFGIDDVVSAQLEFVDGVCTGRLLSECMEREKLKMLQEYMQRNGIEGGFEAGVSDSRSDLPMLELCRRKIVVSRDRHQPWVTEDMEEIVWE